MSNIRTKKILAGIGILFLACVLGSLLGCVAMRVANEAWITGIKQAAVRVGVEPTLNGLEGYIVKSVKPGMSREQVEKALSAMAPLEIERGSLKDVGADWGPAACDKISLKLGPLSGQVWRITGCYDTEGKLVALHSPDPDFPPLGIYASSQR